MNDQEALGGLDRTSALAHGPHARSFIVERFLLSQVLGMARQMNGDFESLMIWGVLHLQNVARALAQTSALPPMTPNDLLPDRLLLHGGLRSSDLAHVTGIPRETVRRKLERLQASGKVGRHEDGRWHAYDDAVATPAIARDTLEKFGATADLMTALPV